MMTKTAAVVLLFLLVTFTHSVQGQQAAVAGPPPLLTYNELVSLYETDPPSTDLSTKLNKLLTTPFVNNSTGGRDRLCTKSLYLSISPCNLCVLCVSVVN